MKYTQEEYELLISKLYYALQYAKKYYAVSESAKAEIDTYYNGYEQGEKDYTETIQEIVNRTNINAG